MDAKIDDEVEVKTELKTHQELKCVVMGLDGKQEFVLDHSSQYTHSMINFCKQLMSNVKDEQILCQIANERDVNNLSNPVDNVDVLSHRIEYAIDNDVKIVHFVIASIEKLNKKIHLTIDMSQVKSVDKNIDLDLSIPDPNDKLGDRRNLWLEAWREIHYNLTVSIVLPQARWNDRHALYSLNGILIKSKQDFVNVVAMALNDKQHKQRDEMKKNDDVSVGVQQIKFVIKV